MDAYPPELVSHLIPLLFVAGLNSTETQINDSFLDLTNSLSSILTKKKGFQLWDNSRGVNCDFHITLVDKSVRFPALKAKLTSEQPTSSIPHSPISPLSPSSPLYPDGIMAPIWIKKHREMVPCIFLLVLKLFEFNGNEPLSSEGREEAEREGDYELVQQIIDRRRSTSERGIKLAVILLCSRNLLDSTTLDGRLSLIRRQSGLDSRSSLFVISPVTHEEVGNFVDSLKGELFPAALDYYREHGRRVRRKRTRTGKVGDKRWNVRYDYKMGVFSEMRGEIEVSLKHYEDSYQTLVEMFSSPLLVPRTKRWAEAKVLADCLSFKISKMNLYLNESNRAVEQLNRHVSKFKELSNFWGIGEKTFEFWSWLSKQYRLFAELVSIAVRSGFRIPSLIRTHQSQSQALLGGATPLNVLQHAGYYFYLAGTCSVERRERYRDLYQEALENGAVIGVSMGNEGKIDHAEIIIDLYTKAYEYFKSSKTTRMTLFIASQIALAHYEAANHEMSLKFHERIAKTYRRENFRNILDPILQLSVDSALQIGDKSAAIPILFELLSPRSQISTEGRSLYAGQLLNILKTKMEIVPPKIVIDMNDIAPLFDSSITFFKSTASLSEPILYQLTISSNSNCRSSAIIFNFLQIQFNDQSKPIAIRNEGEKQRIYELGGEQNASAELSWENGSAKTFSGTVMSSAEADLTISSVTLTLTEGDWNIELLLSCTTLVEKKCWFVESEGMVLEIPLEQTDTSICSVKAAELKVEVEFDFIGPAFVEEDFEVSLSIRNDDIMELEVFLDILLQPEVDDSVNTITMRDQSSTSYIKSISLGNLSPSKSITKSFNLLSLSPGTRLLDLSFHFSSLTSSAAREIIKSISILVISPFYLEMNSNILNKRREIQSLLDLSDPTGWEGAGEVGFIVNLAAKGEIIIKGIELICDKSLRNTRVVESSVEAETFPLDYKTDDVFTAIYRLDVIPPFSDQEPKLSNGFVEIRWSRPKSSKDYSTRYIIAPIVLETATVSVTFALPPFLTLHIPTQIAYRFSNPTPHLLHLNTIIESNPSFIFAGPRKIPDLILAPSEERIIEIGMIPLVVGSWKLPKLRVFERILEIENDLQVERNEEILVEEEGEGVEGDMEKELRIARGEFERVREPLVLVVPR